MSPRPPAKKPKKRKPSSHKQATNKPQPKHSGTDYPTRLPEETDAAYSALCTYLDADPDTRSLRSVFGPSRLTSTRTWSSQHQWQARAAAFDDARRRDRLQHLTLAQREADLATQERDQGLRRAAGEILLDADTLANLRTLAKTPDASAIQAVKLLYKLSGVEDLRKLRLTQAAREAALIEAAADPAVVAALAVATPEQLAALRSKPPLPDEYAAEEADADKPEEGQ